MIKSRTIVILLTVLSIAAIVVLLRWPGPLKSTLGEEPYKLFLQFALVTVVGGLVSAVFAQLKRESELREARQQELRTFHTTAVSAYNRAKKLRRLLTVLVPHDVSGTIYVRMKEYQALMTELEDVQLEFESMKRQVGLATDLFANEQDVKRLLHAMEKYLRIVLREFEGMRLPDGCSDPELSSFPDLQAFIDDTDQPGGFVKEFSARYDKVEATLLKMIKGN